MGVNLYPPTASAAPVVAGQKLYLTTISSQTNSTTLVNEPTFTFTLGAGTWQVFGRFAFAGQTSIQTKWSTVSGAYTNTGGAYGRIGIGPGTGSTGPYQNSDRGAFQAAGPGNIFIYGGAQNGLWAGITEEFVVTVASSVTIAFQWAQNVASTTQTQLLPGSRVIITQLP